VLLRDRLGAATQRAQRHGALVAAVFIDLDRFKPVNDTHGHLVGDALLRAVGERLLASLRATDTVARWGGDEFVCVLEGVTDADAAMHVAAQLHRALLRPYEVATTGAHCPLELGASVGVAVLPLHATEGEGLLECADQAMYAAKRAGGGCVLWGAPGMRSLAASGEVPIVPRQRRVTWPTRDLAPDPARSRAGSGG
jgi:diguanylate cyclase (GGDEF)-like protein